MLLIIDDHADTCLALQRLAKNHNAYALTAHDAETARRSCTRSRRNS
jgi:hypothetical protein